MEGGGWRVEGGGWRVEGGGCRVQGAGCRVQGAGCRVQGAGCRVQGGGWRTQRAPDPHAPDPSGTLCFFFFFFITLGLELSDTNVYEPEIRALLGTASHYCEAVDLEWHPTPMHPSLLASQHPPILHNIPPSYSLLRNIPPSYILHCTIHSRRVLQAYTTPFFLLRKRESEERGLASLSLRACFALSLRFLEASQKKAKRESVVFLLASRESVPVPSAQGRVLGLNLVFEAHRLSYHSV